MHGLRRSDNIQTLVRFPAGQTDENTIASAFTLFGGTKALLSRSPSENKL